jgi:hypothetical protein
MDIKRIIHPPAPVVGSNVESLTKPFADGIVLDAKKDEPAGSGPAQAISIEKKGAMNLGADLKRNELESVVTSEQHSKTSMIDVLVSQVVELEPTAVEFPNVFSNGPKGNRNDPNQK